MYLTIRQANIGLASQTSMDYELQKTKVYLLKKFT